MSTEGGSSSEKSNRRAEAGAFTEDAATRRMEVDPDEDTDTLILSAPGDRSAPTPAEMQKQPIADPDESGGVPATRVNAPIDYRSDADTQFVQVSDFSEEGEPSGAIDVSLSDMEPVSDAEHDRAPTLRQALPGSLDEDADGDPAAAVPDEQTPVDPYGDLPSATVVTRRSHNPASLFDPSEVGAVVEDDTAPARDAPPPAPETAAPVRQPTATIASQLHDEETAMPSDESSGEESDDVDESPPAPPVAAAPSPPAAAPPPSPAAAAPEPAAEAPDDDDEAAEPPPAARPPDAATGAFLEGSTEQPPLLHKWKVVPTAMRELDDAGVPRPNAPNLEYGRVRAVSTVLWDQTDARMRAPEDDDDDDDDDAKGEFWEETDHGDEETSTAGRALTPEQRAAAYVHDAVAFLRSLGTFAAYLDEDVRGDFEGRVMGAKDKLRRALTLLHVDDDAGEGDED